MKDIKYRVAIGLMLLIPIELLAQEMDPIAPVLKQIEQNNKMLQASRARMEAELLEIEAENNLSDPEVNYAHLFNSERGSKQQSELTVVQGFEFPTAYIVRKKFNRLQSDVAQCRYMIDRRNILLEAKKVCLDMIGLNLEANLLEMLVAHADSLVRLCDKRLQSGDATSLEVNRAKLELMALRTELADNVSAYRAALQKLLAMNGHVHVEEMVDEVYPPVLVLPDYEALRDEVMAVNHELKEADAAGKAAQKSVSVSRQGWLPRLQVGYRRNTAPTEKFNGFVVGGAIPLFENRKKVKAAQAQSRSIELMREELAFQEEAALQSLYNEVVQVKSAMAAYDLPLMDESFKLLQEALHGGELTWHEYFVELEALVRRKQAYLRLGNRYQKLLAEIYADSL